LLDAIPDPGRAAAPYSPVVKGKFGGALKVKAAVPVSVADDEAARRADAEREERFIALLERRQHEAEGTE
jgi:hypothetical protein